jgi:hypothetical protein
LVAADIGVAIGSGSKSLCQLGIVGAIDDFSKRRRCDIKCILHTFIIEPAKFAHSLRSIAESFQSSEVQFREQKFEFYRFGACQYLPSSRQLYAAMYNCIALPIAAGVVYPAGHVRLAPVWASLAMALS